METFVSLLEKQSE